jgi:hypothetical protein
LALKIKLASLLVGMAHLDLLLHKAGFRPDEPRVPAGNPDGGQWTGEGGPGSSPPVTSANRHIRVLQVSEDNHPEIPDRPPLRPRDRYAIVRLVLRRSPIGRAVLTAWRIYEVASDAFTYFDEPKTLEELEQAAKEPKTGYDIHHIVEQTPGRRDGYPETWINSPENTVRIPRFRHWDINRWYSTKNEDFGGMTPRDYLRGKTWQERYEIGLKALKKFGVLK